MSGECKQPLLSEEIRRYGRDVEESFGMPKDSIPVHKFADDVHKLELECLEAKAVAKFLADVVWQPGRVKAFGCPISEGCPHPRGKPSKVCQQCWLDFATASVRAERKAVGDNK